ncbi:penicillin-binding protein activator [Pontivivens insulae]|uniref:Leucine-binding protein domain-containing protein n=1 Tax=Pontivivens insulae TaxID=1639689 RepID=A0A2R8AEU5_9RHOB|nr:penicillin-binding protein activator [Pontivivens insulae]RED12003.1 amino acid/amide ABC transporter substrate-binding protein (HAAT family) [Pontivivens insulae]SPF30759.1 hypothetical protein POI8812_03102 [Pontivivens insulae]
MRILSSSATTFLRGVAATIALTAVAACTAPVETSTAPAAPVAEPAPAILAPGQIDPNGPVNVALLIPSGGADAERNALAQSLENAARLAIADAPDVTVNLRTYSTAGDPARATQAASQAIVEGADVLVGPLFSASVAAAGPIAQAAGVPVLSFSNNSAVAGANVYVLGNTFESRATRLLSYAAANGLRRTGIIHTQDAEGNAALNAVRTAASSTGTDLVATSSYPRSRDGIPAAGQAFTNAMTSAGVNNLVMSDSGAGLVYASTFLPFHGMNMSEVQVIGLQDLSDRAFASERTLEGAWFTTPDAGRAAAFQSRYTARYGTSPHALAPIAYDGIAVVTALMQQARATGNVDAFAATNLTSPSGFTGVEGAFRLTPGGGNERALAIMEVTRDGPQLVDPAPGRFGVAGF